MPSPDPAQLTGQLRGLLEPVVTAAGFELDAVEVRAAGRRHAVTVVVDRPEDPADPDADGRAPGVGLDDVATLSRAAAGELDRHEDLIDGAYTLEVTSPGVDRPLTRPRHWRRAWLRLATIRLTDGTELQARVGRAGETGVALAVPGKRPELREIEYALVDRAQVQVEFKDPPSAEVELLSGGPVPAESAESAQSAASDQEER